MQILNIFWVWVQVQFLFYRSKFGFGGGERTEWSLFGFVKDSAHVLAKIFQNIVLSSIIFACLGYFKAIIFLNFGISGEIFFNQSIVIALFEKKYPTLPHPSSFIASSGWVCIFGKIRILLNVLKTSLFVLSLVSAK